MPASTTGKGLQYGWTLGENGWKAGMDENALRLDAMAHEQWAQNRAATAGLTYGYFGGVTMDTGAPVRVANGTVALANNTVNYVERTAAGVVSANAAGFTAGRIPMAKVTTAAGAITAVEDWRPAFSLAPLTGWSAATGTATRTGFDTATATLVQVAEALKAVIDDLLARGVFRP
ncbi:MAG: hypothetical protein IPL76_08730 [Gemmatimonadetes bacterium]|nr:hypothetical protein [Gemmatimonadota bacterium]